MSTKTGEQLASLAFNRNAESDAFLFVGAPELLDLAKAHEAWEADVILNADWSRELPTLTLAQWDRLIELQAARNAAIAKAEGRS